ncbi:AMIN domain-containing protein [Paenibacillus cremeus]|uniref:AMIN domain-containing protein n=2 Tax=Paenibacillus cremeus TaxID=2163881 RepID=A0A559KHW1_9BACL|nr:AMIN domain-containing protein [Paenibacillus cremeus]
MKVITAWLTLLLVSLLMLPTLALAAVPQIQLFMNGKPLLTEVAPQIVNNTTIVPVRVIAESVGSKVTWDSKAKKVTVDKDSTSIQLFIDKTSAMVNNKSYTLEAAPSIINGNTMLPLRFVSEQLGVKVTWDEITKSVFLYNTIDAASDQPASIFRPEETVKAGDPAAGDKKPTDQQPAPGQSTSAQPSVQPPVTPATTIVQGILLKGDTVSIKLSDKATIKPNSFQLSGPERIIVDLPNVKLDPLMAAKLNAQGEAALPDKSDQVSQIRYSLFSKEPSIVRIVIDLPRKSDLKLTDAQQTGEITLKLSPATSKGKFKVVIDPGHGGKDTGAISITKRNEKDFVLSLGKKVVALLQKEPMIEPIMTRSDDTFIELADRAAMANEAGADLFVSIHANSAPGETARGAETYYYTEQSQDFAALMHKYLIDGTGFPDRKVKQDRFYVIKNTTMPSVLLEIGFLTNHIDEAAMYQDAFQNQVAASLVAAIKKQLNID